MYLKSHIINQQSVSVSGVKYQHLYLFDKFIIKFSDNLVGEGHDFFLY